MDVKNARLSNIMMSNQCIAFLSTSLHSCENIPYLFIKWLCSPRVLEAQWIECLLSICEVMGLIRVGDSEFFLFPMLATC